MTKRTTRLLTTSGLLLAVGVLARGASGCGSVTCVPGQAAGCLTAGSGGVGGGSSSAGESSSSSGSGQCAGVFQGDFTLQNAHDLATISPYCEITGKLALDVTGLATITLPALQKVDGDIDVQATGLKTLSMPVLQTVGGHFQVVQALDLATLDLPLLTFANGLSAETPQTPVLGAVHLQSLVKVGPALTGLRIGSFKLGDVQLPALASVDGGGVYIAVAPGTNVSLPALAGMPILVGVVGAKDVTLPLLTHTGQLSADATGTVSAPQLGDVEGGGGIHIQGVSGLSLPVLATASPYLDIIMVAPGTSVTLPALTMAGEMHIYGAGDVTLPLLVHATNLEVIATGTLSAPKLADISSTGPAVLSGLAVEGVSGLSMPALTKVGGELWVKGTSLATLDLPSLKQIDDDLSVGDSPCGDPSVANLLLTQLHLPALTTIGPPSTTAPELYIGSNPLLPQCRIDALVSQLQAQGWKGTVSYEGVCPIPSSPCP